MHTKYVLYPTCMLTYTCIYDYNAEELASLSLLMEINVFSHFIYRFLSLFFCFFFISEPWETGQLREVEWDQDMNQAQLEPGILCHEYMLHKPSIFQHKPPFFRLQSKIQFIKIKDKMLYNTVLSLHIYTQNLFTSAFTYISHFE